MTRAASIAAFFLLLACALPCRAQEDAGDRRETAAARALFDEGVALFDSGRLEEAEDRFRRSLAIRRTPSVMFNLAAVLVQRGHLVEGEQLFREVAVDDAAPERLRSDARARAEEVSPRIARLTVHVRGDASTARIRVDELELSAAMIGVAVPVDPGSRRVVAEVGETVAFDRSIELAEGGSESVTITLAVATPEEAARAAELPAEPAPAASGDVSGEWWFWTIVAVGVAVLVTGAVLIGLEADSGRYFSGNLSPGRVTLP